ncbi:hypothetical protein JCM16138_07540 [Thermococcus atlanticus]
MGKRAKLFSTKTFIVNSSPPGGAWVFDEDGELLTYVTGDELLVWG